MNAIELLKQQHDIIRKAFDRSTKAEQIDARMLRQLADQLVAHMVIEEHVFYPRVRELMKDMIAESFEEHAVVRFELARAMMARGGPQRTRLIVTKELLAHHLEEEERELFPKVRRNLRAEELERLGLKMEPMYQKAVQLGIDALVGDGQQILERVTVGARGAIQGRAPMGARKVPASRARPAGGRLLATR